MEWGVGFGRICSVQARMRELSEQLPEEFQGWVSCNRNWLVQELNRVWRASIGKIRH